EMCTESGDPGMVSFLRKGIEAIERSDLPTARSVFTRLIEEAPTFAEGWNKRALVRYLAKDYSGSIADCRETLARNPYHFGALSGQGLCHLALGEFREAADLFRLTLTVHPHLRSARENLRSALGELVRRN